MKAKKSIVFFLTLILLGAIIQPFLAIVIPVAYAEQEQLWCVNFDFTYNEWDVKGDSPYLNDNDDKIKTKNIGAKEGNFGFAYSSEYGTINNVTLYIEGKSEGGNVKIYVSDDDGYSFTHEGNIIFEKDWLYKTLDLSIKLDTWIKINSAKIYIMCQEKGGGKNLEIIRAYLNIDYEIEPEPDPEPDPDPGPLHESEGDYIDSWDISSESGDALTITTDGTNIWILDYADDYVYKYDMIGGYIDSWDIYYSAGSDDAFGMTTDGSNIWIADYGDSEVYKFTMAGVYVDSWDTSAQSDWLYGIATDGNYIWLLDYFAKEVYKYSMAGVYTDEHWDTSAQSTDTTEITTDGNYFWTVSPDDAEVYKYHMNGTYIGSWDISVQSGAGYGVTTDGVYVWIVDHVDDEVYKYEGPLPPAPPTPPDPINLFGAGFNASIPYVDLIWTHNLTDTDFFEVQNSTDKISWDYLGQNTTTQYTDFQVVNGTERYYRVRACNYEVVGGWSNSSFSDVNFEKVYFVIPIGDGAIPNIPQIDKIEFNTTIAEERCGVLGVFSDVEGLSGYIFWNNATSAPGGVNSSFTALAGVSDDAIETITLPVRGTRVGVKYYVNDTDNNWAVDTLVIFTTIRNVTTCEAYEFNASSIHVVAGTLDAGNLGSTYVIDGDWYNVSEVAGSPGLDIRFNFSYVPENITCGCIEIYKTYTGHSQHEIHIEVWNFTSVSWQKIGKALFNETVDWVCVGLGHAPEHYLSGGEMWFRFYHPEAGHIKHTLHIERIDLRVVEGVGLTIVPNPVTTIIDSLFPGLAIGIALFIIAAAYYYYQRR